MGRADLIGNGIHHLIPKTQPVKIDPRIKNADAIYRRRANKLLTQHTGLPPQPQADAASNKPGKTGKPARSSKPATGRKPATSRKPRRR
jgi:hypothetical protein